MLCYSFVEKEEGRGVQRSTWGKTPSITTGLFPSHSQVHAPFKQCSYQTAALWYCRTFSGNYAL